jgi:hypothetical protein
MGHTTETASPDPFVPSRILSLPSIDMVSETFEIEFRGEAGPTLRAAFPEFELQPKQGLTHLRGEFVDQAALHGVIERISSLGLELVAVRRLDDPSAEPDDPIQSTSGGV